MPAPRPTDPPGCSTVRSQQVLSARRPQPQVRASLGRPAGSPAPSQDRWVPGRDRWARRRDRGRRVRVQGRVTRRRRRRRVDAAARSSRPPRCSARPTAPVSCSSTTPGSRSEAARRTGDDGADGGRHRRRRAATPCRRPAPPYSFAKPAASGACLCSGRGTRSAPGRSSGSFGSRPGPFGRLPGRPGPEPCRSTGTPPAIDRRRPAASAAMFVERRFQRPA